MKNKPKFTGDFPFAVEVSSNRGAESDRKIREAQLNREVSQENFENSKDEWVMGKLSSQLGAGGMQALELINSIRSAGFNQLNYFKLSRSE